LARGRALLPRANRRLVLRPSGRLPGAPPLFSPALVRRRPALAPESL